MFLFGFVKFFKSRVILIFALPRVLVTHKLYSLRYCLVPTTTLNLLPTARALACVTYERWCALEFRRHLGNYQVVPVMN